MALFMASYRPPSGSETTTKRSSTPGKSATSRCVPSVDAPSITRCSKWGHDCCHTLRMVGAITWLAFQVTVIIENSGFSIAVDVYGTKVANSYQPMQ